MTIDYGEDLSCLDDLEEECRVVSDPKIVLAQALVRRWQTPRGMLLDDPDYGTDLCEFLNEDVDELTLVRFRSEVRSEALKDERVIDCTIVSSTFSRETGRLTFEISIDASESLLRLVVAVTDVTVSLLSVE